jgi:hypothetical protein
MSDEALANAFAELHSLQDQQAEIDSKIAAVNETKTKLCDRITRTAEFIVAWHEFAGVPVPTVDAVLKAYRTPEAILDTPVSLKVTGNPRKEVVAAASAKLIAERDRPIPRPELHDLLKKRGLEVRGSDPLVTLSTMLWRAGPIQGLLHLRGHGYWLADKPYAPTGYIPGKLVMNELDLKPEGPDTEEESR